MSTTVVQTLAFVLLLVALPLTSLGTTNDQSVIWWLGLVAVLIGSLLAPATRFGLGTTTDEET